MQAVAAVELEMAQEHKVQVVLAAVVLVILVIMLELMVLLILEVVAGPAVGLVRMVALAVQVLRE
jgi:hypothetical protein